MSDERKVIFKVREQKEVKKEEEPLVLTAELQLDGNGTGWIVRIEDNKGEFSRACWINSDSESEFYGITANAPIPRSWPFPRDEALRIALKGKNN